MAAESWLSPGFRTRKGAMVRRRVEGGSDWQIFDIGSGARMLACTKDLADRWVRSGLLESGLFEIIEGNHATLLILEVGGGYRLESIDFPDSSFEASDAEAFAHALVASMQILPDLVSREALYIESLASALSAASSAS